MKIAVMNYTNGNIDIFNADFAEIEQDHSGDVEDYLQSIGYDLNEIYFMADVKHINITTEE